MDTTKIMYDLPASNTDITGRYGCAPWTADFNNLNTNYYAKKRSAVNPVKTRADIAKNNYETPTTGYRAKINAIQTNFNDIIGNLTTIVSSVVDPNRGLFAGLNCQLLG